MKKLLIALGIVICFFTPIQAQNEAAITKLKKQLNEINALLNTDQEASISYIEIDDDGIFYAYIAEGLIEGEMREIGKLTTTSKSVTVACRGEKSCFFKGLYGKEMKTIEFTHKTNSKQLGVLLEKFIKDYQAADADDLLDYWNDGELKETTTTKPIATVTKTAPANYGRTSKELNAINTYLSKFDNGYYGYLEIQDGYLINYFKEANQYRKAKLSDLGEARVLTAGNKVGYTCKNGAKCDYSSLTKSYHEDFTFSQTTAFNTAELVKLLNAVLQLQPGASSSIRPLNDNNATNEAYNSNLMKKAGDALQALNQHILTLDDGRYKGIEIKDGVVYSHYANKNYAKANLEDLAYVTAVKEDNHVKLACMEGKKCVYSTITNSTHDYLNFNVTQATSDKTVQLLNTFLTTVKAAYAEYKATHGTTTANETADDKTYAALQKLNDYLEIYNKETYRAIEVIGGYVFFNFNHAGKVYTSKISKPNLIKYTKVVDVSYNTIKIQCTNNATHFSSDFDNEKKNHFQFFTYSNGDKAKLKKLIEEFIATL